ncbi:MAG: crotonase/enoyl-CoA hydratase family protein [Woeseiaceae bacterium]|nr:crotonase/enoyl-CoA hydratase family protein [Woeseiaceae bacterium]
MSERVSIAVNDHVAVVTLNRPEKKNAVDAAMFEALTNAGENLRANAAVRAVVLHGAGGNFCAGIDTAVFQVGDAGTASAERMRPQGQSPANFYQGAACVWQTLEVPVIAAIEGYCFGAGLQIAAGADIRHAQAEARLSIMEVKWGLVPDMGISVTLRDVMPVDRVRELAYSGRIVSGREALQLGLVTAVSENPFESALALAYEIAAKSPDAIRAIKVLTGKAWSQPLAEALQTEARLQLALIGSPNQQEAVKANVGGRKPEYRDADT